MVSILAGVASEQVLHNPKFVTLVVVEGVEGWDTLEERPTGSREKVTVSSPDTGQLMIFKHPKDTSLSSLDYLACLAMFFMKLMKR